MTAKTSPSRRACLVKLVQVASLVPLASLPITASAMKNDALRKSLMYQDAPKDGKQCSTCMQFVPGKSAAAKGGCKIMAGDDEISPSGWCSAYVAKT